MLKDVWRSQPYSFDYYVFYGDSSVQPHIDLQSYYNMKYETNFHGQQNDNMFARLNNSSYVLSLTG
jgi:hypothetical protein